MKDSIREKIGVDGTDFTFLIVMGTLFLIMGFVAFIPFLNAYPVLSVVTLSFILVLGSTVYLLRKYLEVRKLEAQPSAEELLKKQYVENNNLDIEEYEEKYEKMKNLNEKT